MCLEIWWSANVTVYYALVSLLPFLVRFSFCWMRDFLRFTVYKRNGGLDVPYVMDAVRPLKPLAAKLFILNFYPLEVLPR